jgi:hypothetical protein
VSDDGESGWTDDSDWERARVDFYFPEVEDDDEDDDEESEYKCEHLKSGDIHQHSESVDIYGHVDEYEWTPLNFRLDDDSDADNAYE